MTDEPSSRPRADKRVFIKTYGCQMNVYDSQRIADVLRPLGYAPAAAPEAADLVVLNTCHIREKAAEKVYSELGRLRAFKQARQDEGGDMSIVVAGCVAQAEGAEIRRRAPIVDHVLGPQAIHRLPEMIARARRDAGESLQVDFAPDEKFDALEGSRRPDGPTAFLTVQEGCDKFCTFCVVPYTRGAEWSRPVDQIVAEARGLARAGVREVTLLGQNVNAYSGEAPSGEDGRWRLGRLARHLAKIDGLDRLRFTTSHPCDMDAELIAALGEEPKLMPYLHLPLQAGSDRILKAMNRRHTLAKYMDTIDKVRAARPDIALSGDFIVGFPGETEADFEQTLQAARDVGYAQAYTFKYSRRPGTPASAQHGQVAEPAKAERLARLRALLDDQQTAFNRGCVGSRLPVLFEKTGKEPGQLHGRSPFLQAVHVQASVERIGTIADVEIETASRNSLSGRLVDPAKEAA